MTRVAQIGLGGWGKNHCRILNDLNVLVAVCDLSEKIMQEYTKKYPHIPYYKTVMDLCEKTEFDIAVISTPTNTHAQIAIYLINRGKHVFIEKPITRNSDDALTLIKLAKEKKVKLTCGYIERFNSVTKQIKRFSLINGNLIILDFNRENKMPDNIKDVGIIFDTMVHDIDTANIIFDDFPESVFARTGKLKHKHEDYAVAILSYKDNKIATLSANWLTPKRTRTIKAIYENKVIMGDFLTQKVELFDNDKYYNLDNMEKTEPLKNELKSFIDCVENDRPPLVTPEQAYMVTKIAEACLKSAITGKSIPVK